jgi:large conductance mechanosensitive channel
MEHIHSTDAVDVTNFTQHMASPTAFMRGKGKGGGALNEFREFALKGSVLDMAIGIILGVAFSRIITSFVEDITMPLIGLAFGKVDFSNLFVSLTGKHFDTLATARAVGAPTLNYGLFMNAIFNFVIVALGVFLLIRQVNRLQRQRDSDVQTRECSKCTSAISSRATRCPYCTSELAALPASTTASPAIL